MLEFFPIILAPVLVALSYFMGAAVYYLSGLAALGICVYLVTAYGSIWVYSGSALCFFSFVFALTNKYFTARKNSAVNSVIKSYNSKIELLKASNQEIKNKIAGSNKDLNKAMQFYTLTKGIADTADWRRMVSLIENALKSIMASKEYAVYLLDSENVLKLTAKQGKWEASLDPGSCLKKPSVGSHKQFFNSVHSEYSNIVCLPFWRESELFGAILLRTNESDISKYPDIEQIWGLLTLGIIRLRIYWNMEMESVTDGLTKLLRRNYFEERLNELSKRAAFFQTSFGLTLIDIDHFKTLNDTYGHQAGDDVLKKVSRILQSNIYETDLLGRWGGEEFVCVFPRSDPQGLFVKADKIRRAIESEVYYAGLEAIKLTISIGIAHFPRDAQNVKELIHAADKALYKAKDTGRNRVVDYTQI